MSQVNWVKSLTGFFVDSKLTPLVIGFSILLGVLAICFLPREEEPQIIVPMADVFVEMPGATPEEVSERVISHMEKLIQEVPGVEYIYSVAAPGKALMTVRFYVGDNLEDSLVKLYNKLYSNFDLIPPGVSKPIIKPKSIDDVPILTLTLWSDKYDGYTLRQIAAQLTETIRQTPDVAETEIIGGYEKFMNVSLIPSSLAAYQLDAYDVMNALKMTNQSLYLGDTVQANKGMLLKVDGFLSTEDDVKEMIVAVRGDKPVYLKNVANVSLSSEDISHYVQYKDIKSQQTSAVTISIAKKKGSNAIQVADNLIKKIQTVRKTFVPSDVHIKITRNYGETAAERSNELLIHMLIAVFSVTALIYMLLGKRESMVVAVAIPTTLALTLAAFALFGFTLNRVTFFALIFSIGILVDDAIVVVENIVRHLQMSENKGRKITSIVVEATNEVGNPTVLATLAVIAAILPMAFVGGLMGPYMRPIPIGSSSAMIFSMLVAFTVIPWTAVKILGKKSYLAFIKHDSTESSLTARYRKTMTKLVSSKLSRTKFLTIIIVALLIAFSLVLFRLVKVKMLPFDNKSEIQVIIDTKESTTLESTQSLAQEIADYLIKIKEVDNYQIYTGVSSPFNFNGLIRHYYLRQGPNVSDIQVNLIPKVNILNPVDWVDGFLGHKRWAQSHDVAKKIRPEVEKIARKHNASVKIAEVPPGPPVLQTIVAEVYGPDYKQCKKIATQIMAIFKKNKDIVDVDWYMESPHKEMSMLIDQEKIMRLGISVDRLVSNLNIAFKGMNIGLLHDAQSKDDIPIWLQLPESLRSGVGNIFSLRIVNDDGQMVPIDNVVKFAEVDAPTSVYHKNMLPVIYVTADVSGGLESPVYAILDIKDKLSDIKLADKTKLKQYFTKQPPLDTEYSIKWDGEWQITYEVFRDLGMAFVIVLILIYALMVGWFHSYKTPLIIMSAIPFSLIGILPAHMLLGAFFTATSMIGFMAGAGIVVRNSIILVDFIELRLNHGVPISEAVIDAGAVRFKPMLLTASAVIVGSAVILFDPIFQGLAISLMAGEVASLFLSRTAVPVLYYMFNKDNYLNSYLMKDPASFLVEENQLVVGN